MVSSEWGDDAEQQSRRVSGERRADGLDALERGALRRRSQFRRQKTTLGSASGPEPPGLAVAEAPLPAFGPPPKRESPSDLASKGPEAQESELNVIRQRLATLEAEQARDHLAVKLLASSVSSLSPDSIEWRCQFEGLVARIESIEIQLAQATFVLSPRPTSYRQPADARERKVELEDQRDPTAVHGSKRGEFPDSSIAGVLVAFAQHTWSSGALLIGTAAALLGVTFKLLSG